MIRLEAALILLLDSARHVNAAWDATPERRAAARAELDDAIELVESALRIEGHLRRLRSEGVVHADR